MYPSLPVELVVENGAREEAGKDVVVTGAETKQKQNKTKSKMRNEIQIVIHLYGRAATWMTISKNLCFVSWHRLFYICYHPWVVCFAKGWVTLTIPILVYISMNLFEILTN